VVIEGIIKAVIAAGLAEADVAIKSEENEIRPSFSLESTRYPHVLLSKYLRKMTVPRQQYSGGMCDEWGEVMELANLNLFLARYFNCLKHIAIFPSRHLERSWK
jgi:hypothetical protein